MILDGKAAVITGAASGIGAGTAKVFAQEGARVALLDLSAEKAREAMADLPPVAAGEHLALEVDVGSPQSIDAAFAEIDRSFERVDALANCAGTRGVGDPLEVTLAEWQKIHDVNLTGTFYCAQHAARRMVAAGVAGSIVNVASVSGVAANDRRTAYSSSKAGVIGLTKSLALDLGDRGIRVNAICPGLTKTGLTAPYFEDAEWVEQVTANIPLRRAATPEEQATVIAFLCSDLAAYVSGSIIPVDAGMLATRPLGGAGSAFSSDRAAG